MSGNYFSWKGTVIKTHGNFTEAILECESDAEMISFKNCYIQKYKDKNLNENVKYIAGHYPQGSPENAKLLRFITL